jgi:hypothetical protein
VSKLARASSVDIVVKLIFFASLILRHKKPSMFHSQPSIVPFLEFVSLMLYLSGLSPYLQTSKPDRKMPANDKQVSFLCRSINDREKSLMMLVPVASVSLEISADRVLLATPAASGTSGGPHRHLKKFIKY